METKKPTFFRLAAVVLLASAFFLLCGCSSTGTGWEDTFDNMEEDSGPDTSVKVYHEADAPAV